MSSPVWSPLMASWWSQEKGKTLLYCEPTGLIRLISPSPVSSHPTGLLAFCAIDTPAFFLLNSPCSLMPQDLCTCSLYRKCALSFFTCAFPLILQNRFWLGLFPQRTHHRLGQIHLLEASMTSSNTSPLSPSGSTSWAWDPCSHGGLYLEDFDAWFNPLLSPSWNSQVLNKGPHIFICSTPLQQIM